MMYEIGGLAVSLEPLLTRKATNDGGLLLRARCGQDRHLWGWRWMEMHGQAGVTASQTTSEIRMEITDFQIVTYSPDLSRE
jgi:hypothetical protein